MLPLIRVFNTLTRRLEVFEPFAPGIVKMYVCGPTVYDDTHVGHARTYVAFDVVRRYLRLRGYSVVYVQNITDIDDKIINRARSEGVDWKDIVERYTKDYMEALSKLRIDVHVHPRVTHHIADIIAFIEGLIEKGYAYVSNGSVYFEVDRYPEYGKLSGRGREEEWRQEEESLREKKKPYDFALWKKAKPGEPWWESPWGPGRPGWHIECSVMSSRYLGPRIDVHGGGEDLVFPHHENEIAQSEAYFGTRPWVKYWLHAGYLKIRGEKMSKSLGNIVPLREAFKRWKPEVLRLWLASVHYRSQVDFSEDSLEQASKMYSRLVTAASKVSRLIYRADPDYELRPDEVKAMEALLMARYRFHEAMSNDFNASMAVSAVYDITGLVFKHVLDSGKLALAMLSYQLLSEVNEVLGVLDEALRLWRGVDLDKFERLVNVILDVRQQLRNRRMFELSDMIRAELSKVGIKVMDYRDRSEWVYEG